MSSRLVCCGAYVRQPVSRERWPAEQLPGKTKPEKQRFARDILEVAGVWLDEVEPILRGSAGGGLVAANALSERWEWRQAIGAGVIG